MTATPPDAKNEYSRGSWRPRRPGRVPTAAAERAAQGLLGAGAVGVLLIAGAEFATLYSVHTPTSLRPIQTVTAGAHNAYALLPVALLAGLLVAAAWHQRSRPALLALVALGIVVLGISLVGDLPDTHAHGLIRQTKLASNTPGVGLYLETLGGILLVLSGGALLLLWAGPAQSMRRRTPSRRVDRPAGLQSGS